MGTEWLAVGAGLGIGAIIGAAARWGRFCTLAALERHWYANDSTGLRTWVLAIAVAVATTQFMVLLGAIDLSPSFYLQPNLGWTGAIGGGLAFGFGMAMVGTCGFGALVRLGGGSLRALIALLVLGLSALAAQRGLTALTRGYAVDSLSADLTFAGGQSLDGLATALFGFDTRLLVAAIVTIGLLVWVFADRTFTRRGGHILTATIIGGGVAAGWLATYWAGQVSFSPVQLESASFVVPVGDVILHFATYTGVLPDYGVGLVLGVVLGAAVVAWRSDDIRWEACDDAKELGRHIGGAFLMGTGGVFALGCTIGQGISAASTLALSAPIVFFSIMLGARLGLAWYLEGSIWRAFRFNHRDSTLGQ
jgi:uncharacterized membrane protein YedE/YeeE/general stress protein CsbA